MQEHLYVIILSGLAGAQLIDTWINGTIFRKLRAIPERWQQGRFPMRYVGELALCPRCLSHWVSIPLVALVCAAWGIDPHLLTWPVLWLGSTAVSRLAFRLAGGDEEKEDPLEHVETYRIPEGDTEGSSEGSSEGG